MNSINNLAVFVDNNIDKLNVDDQKYIKSLCALAPREVARCLKEGDVKGALVIKDKVEAVRNYLKKKNAKLEYLNQMAVCTLDCIRSIGAWLDENIPEEGGGVARHNSRVMPRYVDIGIHPQSGWRYKMISRYPEEKYQSWKAKIITPDGDENIATEDKTAWITFNALYNLARPPKDNGHEPLHSNPAIAEFYEVQNQYRNALATLANKLMNNPPDPGVLNSVIEQISLTRIVMNKIISVLKKVKEAAR